MKVTTRFLNEIHQGGYRKNDHIYTKWMYTNKVITKFNALFNNLKHNWQGHENDAIILNQALQIFRT